MTEKKKRGRPRKIESFNPSNLQKEVDEVFDAPKLPKNTKDEPDWQKDLKEKGYGTTPNKGILAIDADKFKPFPDNWYALTKVEKLAWLTANPR